MAAKAEEDACLSADLQARARQSSPSSKLPKIGGIPNSSNDVDLDGHPTPFGP